MTAVSLGSSIRPRPGPLSRPARHSEPGGRWMPPVSPPIRLAAPSIMGVVGQLRANPLPPAVTACKLDGRSVVNFERTIARNPFPSTYIRTKSLFSERLPRTVALKLLTIASNNRIVCRCNSNRLYCGTFSLHLKSSYPEYFVNFKTNYAEITLNITAYSL